MRSSGQNYTAVDTAASTRLSPRGGRLNLPL
jgi:hypothetical protein